MQQSYKQNNATSSGYMIAIIHKQKENVNKIFEKNFLYRKNYF